MNIQDLDPDLRTRIDGIFFRAYSLFRDGLVEPAIMEAEQAWQALPEPKFGWDVTLSYTDMLARLYRGYWRLKLKLTVCLPSFY